MRLSDSVGQWRSRDLITFFSGDDLSLLESINKPFTSFCKRSHEEALTFMDCIRDPSKIIFKRDRERLSFQHVRTIEGKHPVKCFPFSTPVDLKKSLEFLHELISRDHGYKTRSFAPKKQIEDIFGISKDPETLDDSDIDNLLIADEPDNPLEECMKNTKSLEMKDNYLLVTSDSIYLAGDATPIKIFDGITDCKVFDTLPNTVKSFVLVTTRKGHLYTIYIKDDIQCTLCMQSFSLGYEGPWLLIKDDSTNQFVATNKNEGICKFFEFESFTHFNLINNMAIEDAFIFDGIFLKNRSNGNLVLFIPTLKYQVLVYFCFEWDPTDPEVKKVHHLPYFTQKEFKCCIPVGNLKCLVFLGDAIQLVSANQIMSGETSFQTFYFNVLKNVSSFFEAPRLLQKLHKDQEGIFKDYTDCTILSTRGGNIVCCFTSNRGDIAFYSLTRFKGLKSICPVNNQRNENKEYDVVVISFGRTLKLTLDLTKMTLLTENAIIPSLNGVIFKHTLDSSTEESKNLLIINPPKINSRFTSEVWITSPVALTQLRINSPIRKLNNVCALPEFQVCNSVTVFSFNEIGTALTTKMFKEIQGDPKNKYLIFATDKISLSKAYILDLSVEASRLGELDDLLCGENEHTIDIFFSHNAILVQVTQDAVYVELQDEEHILEPNRFSPGWKIEGVSHCIDKVVIWSVTEKKFFYIDGISELCSGKTFKRSALIEKYLKCCTTSIEFLIIHREEDNRFLLITSGSDLVSFNWEDIVNGDKMDTRPTMIDCGECRSVIWLPPQLLFVGTDSKLTTYDIANNIKSKFEIYYGNKDYQVRIINSNCGLVFSTQEITFFSLWQGKNDLKFYDLNLPYQSKLNPILDVQVDPSAERIFVLYSNGLQIFDLSYFTWNFSNYLLRSTKLPKKKTIFVEKLNRMLIVSFENKEWDCLKLSDGKILELNPLVLAGSKTSPLSDVAEIPNSGKIVFLVMNFKSYIKLVHLIPSHGKIIIKEQCRHEFGDVLFPDIKANKNGQFFVLQYGKARERNKSLQEMKILKLDILHDREIHLCGSLGFEIDATDTVKDFELVGNNDFIMRDDLYGKLFFFKDFDKMLLENKIQAIPLNDPLNSKFIKICPLDDNTFVVIYHFEGESNYTAELLFYHKADMTIKGKLHTGLDEAIRQEDKLSSVFQNSINRANEEEKILRSDVENQEDERYEYLNVGEPNENLSNNDPNGGVQHEQASEEDVNDFERSLDLNREDSMDIEMDEMDETDAFDRPSTSLGQELNNPVPVPFREQSSSSQHTYHTGGFETETLLRWQTAYDGDLKALTNNYRRPYKTIKLDKAAQDVKFDPSSQLLHVLASDGSVMVFKNKPDADRCHLDEKHEASKHHEFFNSGYKLPNQKAFKKLLHTGHHYFDDHGRLIF